MPRSKVFVSTRILSAFLILFVGGQTPAVSAHPEPSRGTLRPQPDRSGLEEELTSAIGLEEADREILLEQIQGAQSWSSIFGNNKPVIWEIGFSPGWALKARAEKERDKNFLGIELSHSALEDFDQRQLPENARVVIADVRLLVEALPTSLRSIDRIVIDFPPPLRVWSANPYLFEPNDFIATLLGLLRPGGQMQVRTESSLVKDHFKEVVWQGGNPAWLTIQKTADPGLPSTPYARSSQNAGRSTFQIRYTVPIQGTPLVAASGPTSLPVASAGLEEPSGRRDEIRGRAMAAFLRRERVRQWHLKRIGAGQVRSRLETQERESAAAASEGGSGGSGPLTPAFPDFNFDKKRWAQIVGEKAGELFEQGVVRIPMGKGEMILLLRGGRYVTHMMIDLLVRPDVNQRRHVYLGRFDLNFSLVGGYWATSAKVSGEEKFDRIDAAHYLNENNISQSGPSSWFEQSRSLADDKRPFYEALYVDPDMAWNLRMEVNVVRNVLALVGVEVIHYRNLSHKMFGADLRYSANTYFPGLGVQPIKVDFKTDATWYPLDQLRWALRERLIGRFRLNGQEWMSQMENRADNLRTQHKIEISLEGGRAVLLLRAPQGSAALDLFLARDGELPRFAGRMDLTSGNWYYSAAGAALSAGSFSRDGALFLEANGINSASSGPMSRSRSEHSHQALWLDEKLLNEFRLEPSLVRDALIFSMLEVLVTANISQWGVDSRFSNDNLVYARFPHWPAQGNKEIFEMKLAETQKALQKELIRSSVRLDPESWVELVEEEGWKLYVDGFVELPIQGGDVVLFFRRSRDDQTLMFDMMLRQSYRGAHVYLASLDLVRDKTVSAYVARGPLSWTPFSGTAEEYLTSKRISPLGESSLFEAFRSDRHNRGALFLNSAVLDQGGLRSEIIQDALLFAVLDVLQSMKKHGFGVHNRYDNGDLLFLGLPPSRYPTPDGGEILLYDRSLLKKHVADRLKKSASGLEERFEDDPENVAISRVSRELEELGVEQLKFPGAREVSGFLRIYGPVPFDGDPPQPISITVKKTGRVLYHRAVSHLKFGRREANNNAFVLTGLLHGADPVFRTRFWLNAETGEITGRLIRAPVPSEDDSHAGLEEPTAEEMLTRLVERIHRDETFLPSARRAGLRDRNLPGMERLFHTEISPHESILHLGEDRYHLDVRLKVVQGVLAIVLHDHLADSGALSDVEVAYQEGVTNLLKELPKEAPFSTGRWIGLNQGKFTTKIYLWVPPAEDSGQNPLVQSMQRISSDIKTLFGVSRYSKAVAQVVSPSVADRYPLIRVLSDLLPRYFFVDPSGKKSDAMILHLRDSRPHPLAAAYYGTDEEFRKFGENVTRLGAQDRLTPVRGDSIEGASVIRTLQTWFASLGGYSELKWVVNKVRWEQLEQDLKLLGEA